MAAKITEEAVDWSLAPLFPSILSELPVAGPRNAVDLRSHRRNRALHRNLGRSAGCTDTSVGLCSLPGDRVDLDLLLDIYLDQIRAASAMIAFGIGMQLLRSAFHRQKR